MDINFELYKVFYFTAKFLSFSEASKSLYISQSAVSQSIALLEEKLKCRLLLRNAKQVRLTQEGSVLYEYIEQAFNFIKAGERNINEIQSLMKGDIRIGASDTICKYYLLPYFKRFHQMYPGVKIQVTNRTSLRCIEYLRKGSVDFSVINIPERHNYDDLEIKTIKTIEDIFVAGQSFKHLSGRQLNLKELMDYPVMVLEKNSTTREFFDDFMKKNNIDLVPEIELGSIDLLIELAKIGLGISYVIKDAVQKELDSGEIFILDIKEKLPKRNLGVITHKGIPINAAAREFINMLDIANAV